MSAHRDVLLAGTIIYGDDFELREGYVCLRDGIIREIGKEKVDADLEGIIAPRLVNAHVHIGDSVIKDPPFMPLSDLVGPGGLKHMALAEAGHRRTVEAMSRTLQDMVETGTWAFIDFREGGRDGVEMILEALGRVPMEARILGRPGKGELDIHESCWGLGISSTRDYDQSAINAAADRARESGRIIGIHAGEAGDDDICDAIRLQPSFLVHMNRASRKQLKEVADLGIPVVICPRSNQVTGTGLPDVSAMIDLGIVVGVGTDNVMLNSPNMLEEMAWLSKALLHDDRQVFKMCTLNGAKIMGIDQRAGTIEEGKAGRLMVIDRDTNNLWGSFDPLSSLVRRLRPSDIMAVF
ncbi:MAG: amidohydrolase family protein [Methanotrichaceae archaeon]|nr:amidohydrolase family protein [Methanotrichaceae archaeon]